jgi:hypothetical protein
VQRKTYRSVGDHLFPGRCPGLPGNAKFVLFKALIFSSFRLGLKLKKNTFGSELNIIPF